MAGSTTPWGLPTETSADTVALSQDFAKLANATNEALNDVKTQVSGAPTLPAAQSLDTITTDAVYGVLDSNGNPNRPAGELTGLLRTTQLTSSATYQVWQGYSNGRMFSRFKGSTGWSNWTRMDVGSALEAPILPAEQSVDSIVTTGRATVLASNANAGMPPGETGSGAVDTIMTGTNSGSQLWRSVGASKTMYLRFRGSLGWSSWTRVDAQYAIDQAKAYADTIAGGGTARPGTGFKVAPLALTVGGSGVDYGSTTGGVRMPMLWGADVTRFRVHIRNINPRFGLVNSGSMLLTGVWFGAHNGSGNFTGTPTQIAGSANTPSNGDEWVSPWVTTPMTAGTQYLLAYGFSSGAAPKAVVGGGWVTPSASDAANNAAAKSAVTVLPLDVWIEAETPAATPLIAWLGDSLSSGVGATRPVYDSVASQYARANQALPIHYTASGDTASAWSNPNQFKWNRWAGLARPDAVVMAFGSNDVFGGDGLATVQGNWGTVVDNAARLLSPNVYSTTVLPRDGVTGDQETTRRALNSWIKTQPSGVRDVFDIVPAVSSDDETLNSGLSGDGIHLSTAGYALVKGAIVRTLAPVMAAGPAGPAGSVSDTAVADLVSSGAATGTAFYSKGDARYVKSADFNTLGDARYAPIGSGATVDPNGTLQTGRFSVGAAPSSSYQAYVVVPSGTVRTGLRVEQNNAGGTADAVKIVNQSSGYALKIDQAVPDQDVVNITATGTGAYTSLGMGGSNTTLSTVKVTNDAAQVGGAVVFAQGTHTGRTSAIFGGDSWGTGAIFSAHPVQGSGANSFRAIHDTGYSYTSRIFWIDANHSDGALFYMKNNLAQTAGQMFRIIASAGSTVPILKLENSGTGDHIQADNFTVSQNGNVKASAIFNYASFTNARLQLSAAGSTIDRDVADANATLRVDSKNASATGDVLQILTQTTIRSRFNKNGQLAVRVNSAPADADVATGEAVLWFDSTAGAAKIMWKAKDAGGTVRTGSLALA